MSCHPHTPGHPARTAPHDADAVTSAGAAWLASAGTYPLDTLARWADRPAAPLVLPCGTAFDVVNTTALFGRALLDRLWGEGPGSGPVATHRGRTLLFAAPGTAHRLPALLRWEEWGAGLDEVPPLLCHGTGDAVTVPPLTPAPTAPPVPTATTTAVAPGASSPAAPGRRAAPGQTPGGSRWVVAPDTRRPWLPGPEVLLWACVRAARATARKGSTASISPRPDLGANVYDVSRRR
ncbi:hypothetical protein JNUCC64_22755 [Streptomyces sp. JNUCC 64]